MAKTYVLLQFTIHDAEMFGRYRQAAAPTIMANGGRVLVAANEGDVREGTLPAKLTTIIEFPSKEALEAWYHSPEYRAAKHLRPESTSDGSLVFLEGFTPPTPPTA